MFDRARHDANLLHVIAHNTIPALTVHNPWAALLVLGLKRGENRGSSRSLAPSAGWVLVHSSKKWAGGAVLQYLRPPDEDVAAIVALFEASKAELDRRGPGDPLVVQAASHVDEAAGTVRHLGYGTRAILSGLLAVCDVAHYAFPEAFPEERYELVPSAFLGAVHVSGFVGSDAAMCDPWHQEGQTFWQVDAAVTMPLVEGVAGALGLWKPNPEHTAVLLASRDRWRWTRCGAFLGVQDGR